MGTRVPTPSWFPDIHFVFNEYLAFDFNWPALWAITTLAYYYVLEPTAAVSTEHVIFSQLPFNRPLQLLYTPEMVLIALTSAAFAHKPDAVKVAGVVHVVSWIAQFIGHGAAEGRSPALLDNLLGGE